MLGTGIRCSVAVYSGEMPEATRLAQNLRTQAPKALTCSAAVGAQVTLMVVTGGLSVPLQARLPPPPRNHPSPVTSGHHHVPVSSLCHCADALSGHPVCCVRPPCQIALEVPSHLVAEMSIDVLEDLVCQAHEALFVAGDEHGQCSTATTELASSS